MNHTPEKNQSYTMLLVLRQIYFIYLRAKFFYEIYHKILAKDYKGASENANKGPCQDMAAIMLTFPLTCQSIVIPITTVCNNYIGWL
jgi:hypothetical protein